MTAPASHDTPALGGGQWRQATAGPQTEVRVRARQDATGRLVVTDVWVSAPDITAAVLRSVPIGRIRAGLDLPTDSDGADQQLARPDGTDPGGFSQRVAAAYRAAAAKTHRPAAVLAEQAGVPVTTVHRWILDARRRGHLPPTRKGSAR